MTSETSRITLHLDLDDAKRVPTPYRKRWKTLIQIAGQYDAPYLIFLSELLGLLDDDPDPQFSSSVYSGVDMFGGRDQNWTIRTRRARIHREIEQEISESWQRVEVEKDQVQITGLPDDVFIEWGGDWNWGLDMVVGNIPEGLEPAILQVAQDLFTQVEHQRQATPRHGKLRADLKREYRSEGGTGAADWPRAAEGLEPLLALLQDEDSDVGQTALQRLKTLNMLDEPNVREALLEALQYGNPIVRQAIAEALGRTGAQQNAAPLVQALQDANSGVREAAADALGWIGDAEVVPALQEALLDSQFRVRWVAAAALGKIAGRHPEIAAAITPALVPLLSDESQYVRSAAADVLRDLPPDRDLVEPFIQCLRDSYFGVRLTAVQVLGALDDPRAVAELIPLLTDSDDSVALAAVEALVQLGDPRAVKPLRALQKFASKRGGEMARAIDRALARLRA